MASPNACFVPHHHATWSGCIGYAGWAVRSGCRAAAPSCHVDIDVALRRYDYGFLA